MDEGGGDSGTLSGDGTGAPALNGGFHYKSLTINTHDKGDAGGVAGIDTGSLSNSDDESDIVNDQSDGGETSASGVLTQSGQEIHDDKTVDDENNEEAYTYGTSGDGGGHDAGGYVTVNDHAHDTGGFTEVGGAITEQDTNYTDDDIDTSGSHDDDTNHAPVAGGAETTTADTYVVTQSSSFHDGGTYDQSPGNPTTDNFTDDDTSDNTETYAGNGKGALVTPPVQDWNNLPQIAQGDYQWNAQGTVDDGNFSPVGGPAAASSLYSTANSTTDASTSHHDFGTYTLSPHGNRI